MVVDPWNGPVEKRLVSFVHYSDADAPASDDVVLIRIGNLYLQYNRAKFYNIDTDVPNTVTIVHVASDEDVSDRLAALSDGELLEYRNYNDSGQTLVVQVCSMVQYESANQWDYSILRIYIDDGVHDWSICNVEYNPSPPMPTGNGTNHSSIPNISNYTFTRNHSSSSDPFVDMDDWETDNATTGFVPTKQNQTSSSANEDLISGTIVLAVGTIGAFLLTFLVAYFLLALAGSKRRRRRTPGREGQSDPPTIVKSSKTEEYLEPTSSLDDDEDDVFWHNRTESEADLECPMDLAVTTGPSKMTTNVDFPAPAVRCEKDDDDIVVVDGSSPSGRLVI